MSTPRPQALDSALLIIELLRVIPRRRFITAQSAHQSLEAAGFARDLRSVQRLLDLISLNFPIERDMRCRPYGYRWMEHARGMNLPLLTPQEALLMQLAQAHLAEFLPANLMRTLQPLLTSADYTLLPASAERRWLKKVRRIPTTQPLMSSSLHTGVFAAVSDALFYEHKLRITYSNARREKREALVCPLGLAQQGPRLYLVCRFEGYDNERIIALARVHTAQMIDEAFVYPPGFDLGRYDGEGRFAFGSGQKVRLRFRINKLVGLHLTESLLSSDQTVAEHDDSFAICATVIESKLLDAWLRGFGTDIWDIERVNVPDDPSERTIEALSYYPARDS